MLKMRASQEAADIADPDARSEIEFMANTVIARRTESMLSDAFGLLS